jgi:hypothetical protein
LFDRGRFNIVWSMADPVGRKQQWAIDEVFGNGDLLKKFIGCFTKETFILCKAAVRFARNNQMDIKPVAVRANVDLLAYQQASFGSMNLKVCDIEWPTRIDPTFNMYSDENLKLCSSVLAIKQIYQADVHRVKELSIMTKMLEAHAADLRRLKIRMSLDVELSNDAEKAPIYKHINNFLKALAKCTKIKSLTLEQSDHVEKNAAANTVQLALFRIIKTMQLEVLDFNGNMTIDAGDTVCTLIAYIPPSLRQLIVRDGPESRMFKWEHDDGFSEDIQWVMNNHNDRHALLKSIYLPSSFWSLPPRKFSAFILFVNAKHITHIGFSDAFQLNQEPTAHRAGGVVKFSKPKHMIGFLIADLIQDMVIDLRGGDDVLHHYHNAQIRQLHRASADLTV